MSTQDPQRAVSTRVPQRSRLFALAAVLAGIAATGLVLGFAFGHATLLRDLERSSFTWAIPVGILATLGALTVLFLRSHTLHEEGGTGEIGLAPASLLLGIAGGLLWGGATTPLTPHAFGLSPLAVAVGCAAIAAIVLLGGLLGLGRARRQRASDGALMKTGTLTTATVTDKGYDELWEPGEDLLAEPTFRFVDSAGVARWVTRAMVVDRERNLREGDTTQLWYDPKDPGNTKRIVIKAVIDARGSTQG